MGGSLVETQQLTDCLEKIAQRFNGYRVVLVPGGGVFADHVRIIQQQYAFNDRTAHCMAILAMQQTALLVAGVDDRFKLATYSALFLNASCDLPVVWSPTVQELDQAGIASTWDITSDSLAVWLAKTISASQLLVVKSASINPNLSLQNLADLGVIDRCFCDFAADADFTIQIINANSL